jgi:MarC family membrane protein
LRVRSRFLEREKRVGTSTLDIYVVIDIFLLLLIGVGPKIALVPFLEVTSGMDKGTKAKVVRKMLVTASSVAVILVLLGEVLAKLLHFSTGSLSVAGGIILLIISVTMVLGPDDDETRQRQLASKDPLRLAVYPLAVPYLLNPAGIVVLVTLSADAGSIGHLAAVIAILALVLVIDVAVFRWANRVSEHIDQSKMLITEKVFGFLLAALAVQLVLNGLSAVGVIHLTH